MILKCNLDGIQRRGRAHRDLAGGSLQGVAALAAVLLAGIAAGSSAASEAQMSPTAVSASPASTPQSGAGAQTPPAPSSAKVPGDNPTASQAGTAVAGASPADASNVKLPSSERTTVSSHAASTPGLRAWTGLTVGAVEFHGVERDMLDPLPPRLEIQPGDKLDPLKVRDSLRRLFATGLYRDIDVQGARDGDRVTLIFNGTPQSFLGTVTVTGIKNDRLASQLVRATKLTPGTAYSDAKVAAAEALLQETLQENGFYQATISRKTVADPPNSQISVEFQVVQGKNAKVGSVAVEGETGTTPEKFRKKGKLKAGSKVTHDTTSRALAAWRKNYQKQDRLEANVEQQSKEYQAPVNHLDYGFGVTRGPIVKVTVEGAKISKGTIKRLIPVYEEGAVDDDLLNEGDRNLRDHFQRAGYFDAHITHEIQTPDPGHALIVFHVDRGMIHRVVSVKLEGNKYFDRETLEDRLSVTKASSFDHHGLYSQALVNADVGAITTLYQSNGFTHVKVTPDAQDTDRSPGGKGLKVALLNVKYSIEEGVQQRIGSFQVLGTNAVPLATLAPLLNTEVGQPYSAANITGDRDTLLGYYYSHGFDQASLALLQKEDPQNPGLINITMTLTEGEQVFINHLVVSGLHYTRPATAMDQVQVHPGDVLDQSALLETQRRMYDLTLFNEVNVAVQNPLGDQLKKNVLLQFTEARRWDINYGFGFEVQTGNPSNCNKTALIKSGILTDCSSNGKTGASPRVLFDVSRINLRGRNQTISLRTSYGSLEKRATVVFQNPNLLGNPKFSLSLSGGYTDTQDVTTYAASRLEGSVRVTHRPSRPNTLIYELTFRRIKVDPNSIQIAPDQIPLASQSVRVGGPGITWLRDTRDNPLDAHRGNYNSVQEFFANTDFASQTDFNRLDMTNSTYYAFGKKKLIVARSTRLGYERSFGDTAANFIPLPERLYVGGATSHRGFGINAAGPRDQFTGFPIGGAGAFVNSTEVRFPNPKLPFVGDSLGFVAFHDMGNVFIRSSEIWPSLLRVTQPHSETCKDLSTQPPSTTSQAETEGKCSFNYFSHAVGTGLRYHTPIGPIRFDLSYNLNPPVYPIFVDYSNPDPKAPPRVGQAPHFNFFFSIGQSF